MHLICSAAIYRGNEAGLWLDWVAKGNHRTHPIYQTIGNNRYLTFSLYSLYPGS